jgi:hypothetical protein
VILTGVEPSILGTVETFDKDKFPFIQISILDKCQAVSEETIREDNIRLDLREKGWEVMD